MKRITKKMVIAELRRIGISPSVVTNNDVEAAWLKLREGQGFVAKFSNLCRGGQVINGPTRGYMDAVCESYLDEE